MLLYQENWLLIEIEWEMLVLIEPLHQRERTGCQEKLCSSKHFFKLFGRNVIVITNPFFHPVPFCWTYLKRLKILYYYAGVSFWVIKRDKSYKHKKMQVSKIGVHLMHLLTFLWLSGVRKFTMSFDCMHVLNLQQNFGERDFKCKCQSTY